ncbi:2493_t:CDS:2 [Scutellospora calospora]|uniref:2493_t:CDS:1 n=1 Tax=Scutellospora calospora TaxID=85575 RepID=A0ACA9LIB6_9GLOM|nr:2493_t:CDS:2 [Scutellospora calospora]
MISESTNDEYSEKPNNPKNWSKKRKYAILVELSCMSTLTLLSHSMIYPVMYKIQDSLRTTEFLVNFMIGIYTLFLAFGSLVWATVSEHYGTRNKVYIFALGSIFVSSVLSALAYDIVKDMFGKNEDGPGLDIVYIRPLIGFLVGSVTDGFIAQNIKWHWIFWISAIISSMLFFLSIALPEIYVQKTDKITNEKKSSDYLGPLSLFSYLKKQTGCLDSLPRPDCSRILTTRYERRIAREFRSGTCLTAVQAQKKLTSNEGVYVFTNTICCVLWRQGLESQRLTNVDFIFQHDNDLKHISDIVTDWLDEKGIEVLTWSPYSPDLNPIEHL